MIEGQARPLWRHRAMMEGQATPRCHPIGGLPEHHLGCSLASDYRPTRLALPDREQFLMLPLPAILR